MRLFRSMRWLMLALLLPLIPASQARAGVFVSVNFGPPALPVYEQPLCPQPGLMWTPGYWAYGPEGYYWVPGAWVPAPYAGALWTPGYWGYRGGAYVFNEGYWGPHVGYYGGVNYGFGYMGIGFVGGEWRGREFAYNTAVVRVNTTIIRNTYVNTTIVRENTIVNEKHVAYSGGPGGIQHQPTPQEASAMHEAHVAPTTFQRQHVQAASQDKTSYAKANGGHPKQLAVEKPLPAAHVQPPAAHANAEANAHAGANGGAKNGQAAPMNNHGAGRQGNAHPMPQQNNHPGQQPQSHPGQQPGSHAGQQPQPHPAQQNRPAPGRPEQKPKGPGR